MIVGSDHPMAVGYRGVGLYDSQRQHRPEQPFVVMREATVEEYLAAAAEDGQEIGFLERLRMQGAFFYDVSVD